MARCARCNAELFGTARFCASCGAPVPEGQRQEPPPTVTGNPLAPPPPVDPRVIHVPDEAPDVNPFAATASPSLVSPFAPTKKPETPPPVRVDGSPQPTPVSPLATSAAREERGVFQELMDAEQRKSAPPAGKKPGTQMMAGAPFRPPAPKKNVAKTVAMGNWKPPGSVPPQAAPSSPKMPASVAAPSALPPSNIASSGYPGSFPQPQPQPPPAGPGGWGWNPPSRGYAFQPGARVNVTWSNGQRYPATVSQVSGTQCLVVFPDGQQHWVEAHYLSAG